MPPPEPTVEGVRDSVKSAERARKMAHVHTDANGVKHDKGTGQFLDETGSNKLIRQSGGDKHAALNEKARALAGGRQKAGANRSWKSKADRKAFEAWAKNTGHEIGPEAWDKFNKLGGSK